MVPAALPIEVVGGSHLEQEHGYCRGPKQVVPDLTAGLDDVIEIGNVHMPFQHPLEGQKTFSIHDAPPYI